jgi:ATP-binding cassette subfamily F protein 3
MLTIDNITCRIGGRLLLDGASATISRGQKIGLVGRNGAGKSTLFRLILGELEAESGRIELARGVRLGTVAQEMPDGVASPRDFVLAADEERVAVERAVAATGDPGRLAELHERLAMLGADTAEARAASILAGLGFSEADQQRPLSEFSGGWRMRAALAAALFVEPELLLLDEPSNHLDLETRLWLETHLARYPGTLLMISHDRAMLNGVVDGILHLRDLKLTLYRGDYDEFDRLRRERYAQEAALYRKQAEQRAHMMKFVERFRYQASKARQAQSRLKALERLQASPPARADDEVALSFPEPGELAPPLVSMRGVAVGYGDRTVLADLDLRLDPDDRIGLLGANGNGKSTFLKLLAGRLTPSQGDLTRARHLDVAYYEQEQADAFDPADTPFSHLRRLMPDAVPEKVRAQLGRFGFTQTKADVQIGKLSGGEKAKLLFATISRGRPQVLLLDEPSNHLDMDAREALIAAVADYPGAVLLVTHDPHLMNACVDRFWLVAGGTCRAYDGDLDDYRRRLSGAPERKAKAVAETAPAQPADRKTERRERAAKRAEVAPLRAEAKRLEKQVERLTRKLDEARAALADPGLYDKGGDVVQDAQLKAAEAQAALQDAEAAWLAAAEELETAETG